MILIANEKIKKDILEKFNITFNSIEEGIICNYIFEYTTEENFYLKEKKDVCTPILKVEVSLNDVWKIDQFQTCLQYGCYPVTIENGMLNKIDDDVWDECDDKISFAYFKRKKEIKPEMLLSNDEMSMYINRERQLKMCDICLMIPGKFKKKENLTEDTWQQLKSSDSEIFTLFDKNISASIRDEYNNEFEQQLSRKCIGTVAIEIENDIVEGERYIQNALVEIVKHDTGLCVMELLVYNCCIGGNKLLSYYRSGKLNYIYKEKKYTLKSFLELFSIKEYGDKRSMIFAYGDVSKQSVINALANEEYPMGKIGGSFEKKVLTENIAQYDTAEVYVSQVSMIECCKNFESVFAFLPENRIAYQAIEIFFVELILFQDAAIDKAYKDLMKEQELQSSNQYSDYDIEKYEQLSFDMSKAVKFGDYRQFNFPITRESAQRVAENFGIAYIYEKYEKNKELLYSMISANKRRTASKENALQNSFLLVISFVTSAQALGEILGIFYTGASGTGELYATAALLIFIGYVLYRFVKKIM